MIMDFIILHMMLKTSTMYGGYLFCFRDDHAAFETRLF